MEIKGCVGLVTGGNRGIGEAFVRVLLESGAQKVYAGSRDPAAAAHLVEQYPGRCVALELDVTDFDVVARAARECQIVIVTCVPERDRNVGEATVVALS